MGIKLSVVLVFSYSQRSGGRWLQRLGEWLSDAGFSASNSLGLFLMVARWLLSSKHCICILGRGKVGKAASVTSVSFLS